MTIFHDDQFVEVDLLLRRGAHINRSSLATYEFVTQNYDELQEFYRRYGCTLLQHPDGFFFMIVKNGRLRTRLLPKSCVHMGQILAQKARDPEITRTVGKIAISQLLKDIETLVPRETLQAVYAPGRRDVTTIDASISEEMDRALRTLANLGFVELVDKAIRPLEAIMRFADLARYGNDLSDDAKLHVTVSRGVVFDGDVIEVNNDEERVSNDSSED